MIVVVQYSAVQKKGHNVVRNFDQVATGWHWLVPSKTGPLPLQSKACILHFKVHAQCQKNKLANHRIHCVSAYFIFLNKGAMAP